MLIKSSAYWINLPGLSVLMTICSLCGLVLYATYKGCDPVLRKLIADRSQLAPFFVMQHLALPGLPGIFVAGIFSGALRHADDFFD